MSNNTNNLTNIDKNNITIGLNNEEDSLFIVFRFTFFW